MRIPVVREGLYYGILLGILGLLAAGLNLILGLAIIFSGGFMVYFFRDPSRMIPLQDDVIVSPADGKVVEIRGMDGDDFLGNGTLIRILLSPFNVHINRSPIEGKIRYLKRVPGSRLPAYWKKANERNERNIIGIEGMIRVKVTQIAGMMCQRIVCWKNMGEDISAGERIGMIKFGSQTCLLVPPNVDVTARIGEKVKSGESILGRVK